MKFGISAANVHIFSELDNARLLAQTAENCGVESIWVVEHVVVPKDYKSTYPYSADGKMGASECVPLTDPLIWMSFVAGLTTTIKVGTGILILPERNPLIVAKEVATLDRLSGGRVILGVGTGWLREEYEALGVPYENRGARLDDYIRALRILWTEAEPTYSGKFVSFVDAISEPKPVQQPVPIMIGGDSDAAARRAGRLGDGYFPGVNDPERLAPIVDLMKKSAVEHDRNPEEIELTVPVPSSVDDAKRLADMGVTRMITILPIAAPEAIESAVTNFAEEFMAKI